MFPSADEEKENALVSALGVLRIYVLSHFELSSPSYVCYLKGLVTFHYFMTKRMQV